MLARSIYLLFVPVFLFMAVLACAGTALTATIQYLVRAAREMLAPAIEAGVALSNPHALTLYQRLGFVDDDIISLDLGDCLEPVLYLRLPLHRH